MPAVYDLTPGGLRKGVGFADQPDDTRMFVRHVIDMLGGYLDSYNDGAILVAMPNDHRHGLLRAVLSEAGFVPNGSFRFPLGSDSPPAHLRHNGGYWYFSRFSVDL